MLKVGKIAGDITDYCIAVVTLVSKVNIAGLIQQWWFLGTHRRAGKRDVGVETITRRSIAITGSFGNTLSISFTT